MRFINWLAITVLVLSAVNFPRTWLWLQEVNINLGGYYLVAHLVVCGLLIVVGATRTRLGISLTLASCVMGLLYAHDIAPLWIGGGNISVERAGISAVYGNFAKGGATPDDFIQASRQIAPDIIGIVGCDEAVLERLGFRERYITKIEIPQKTGSAFAGLALYANASLVGDPLTDLGEGVPPLVYARLSFPSGTSMVVVLFSNVEPRSTETMRENWIFERRVATRLRFANGPILVMADLKASPYSDVYKNMGRWGRVTDLSNGTGIAYPVRALEQSLGFITDYVFARGEGGGMLRWSHVGLGQSRGVFHIELPPLLPEEH